jgi:hypothetical protein
MTLGPRSFLSPSMRDRGIAFAEGEPLFPEEPSPSTLQTAQQSATTSCPKWQATGPGNAALQKRPTMARRLDGIDLLADPDL